MPVLIGLYTPCFCPFLSVLIDRFIYNIVGGVFWGGFQQVYITPSTATGTATTLAPATAFAPSTEEIHRVLYGGLWWFLG